MTLLPGSRWMHCRQGWCTCQLVGRLFCLTLGFNDFFVDPNIKRLTFDVKCKMINSALNTEYVHDSGNDNDNVNDNDNDNDGRTCGWWQGFSCFPCSLSWRWGWPGWPLGHSLSGTEQCFYCPMFFFQCFLQCFFSQCFFAKCDQINTSMAESFLFSTE